MALKRKTVAETDKGVTAKKKAGKPAAKKKSAGERKSPDPRQVRQEMVDTALKSGKEVVVAVIEEAKKGNYLPFKALFEFANIWEPLPEADTEAAARARSLAEILLEAAQETAAPARKNGEPAGEARGNDLAEEPAIFQETR
jgi:hypothetical protein